MKKFIISSFLLLGTICYSQTYTKKYNSMTRQYEYFDSRGSMIGYEIYNNMTRQWEFYEVNQRQSSQYRDPAPVDLSSTFRAQSALQNRYDSNKQYLQSVVSDINRQIRNLNISESKRSKILYSFSETVNNNANRFLRQGGIDALYDIVKIIIDKTEDDIPTTQKYDTSQPNIPTQSSDYAVKPISDYYNKDLKVWNIYEFASTGGNKHVIKSNPFINMNDNIITFKRADGSMGFRDLHDKRYNPIKKGYEFTSQYGAVFVQENLRYIEFFTSSTPTGDNVSYFIDHNH